MQLPVVEIQKTTVIIFIIKLTFNKLDNYLLFSKEHWHYWWCVCYTIVCPFVLVLSVIALSFISRITVSSNIVYTRHRKKYLNITKYYILRSFALCVFCCCCVFCVAKVQPPNSPSATISNDIRDTILQWNFHLLFTYYAISFSTIFPTVWYFLFSILYQQMYSYMMTNWGKENELIV